MKYTGPTPNLNLSTVNFNLEKILNHFELNPELLKQEGILRITGDTAPQIEVLENIKCNPASSILETKNLNILAHKGNIKLDFTHNLIGVLKKMLKEPLELSTNTIEFLKSLAKEKVDSGMFVQNLMYNIPLEEAKLIYNLLFLGVLIAQHQKENKMTPHNVAIVLCPHFANLAEDNILGLNHLMQANIEKIINDALLHKAILCKTFDGMQLDTLSKRLDYFIFEDFNDDILESPPPFLIEMLERYPNALAQAPRLSHEEKVIPKTKPI